jgi:hypothetical protein
MRTGTTIAAIGALVLWTSWADDDEAGPTGGHYGEEGFSHLHLAAFQALTGEYVAQRLLIPKTELGSTRLPCSAQAPSPRPNWRT